MSFLRKLFVICFVFLTLFFPAAGHAAFYEADPVQSSIIFKVNELTGYVNGLFSDFGAVIELSDDNAKIVSLKAVVNVASVFTRNDQRDIDMLGPELFDAAKFRKAKFVSKKIEGDKIVGDLTLKGKTKEIALDYTLSPVSQDRWGRTIVNLTAKGAINRKDFGILYNRKLDTGGFLLDDRVDLDITVYGVLIQ